MYYGVLYYKVMKRLSVFFLMFMMACARSWYAPSGFVYTPIDAGKYTIVTFQRISDNVSPIHIYIEGDGYSFDAHGHPTSDPTPRGTFLRDLASCDTSPNVVYMARPCQFVKSAACSRKDWTSGRFSHEVIDSVATAIKQIAGNTSVVLIGYSGGAMVSGLVIQNHSDIMVKRWITVAGVLNHADWTSYFNDAPLRASMNMDELPNIDQVHYIARSDRVVPNALSWKWTNGKNLVVIENATHTKFPNLKIF